MKQRSIIVAFVLVAFAPWAAACDTPTCTPSDPPSYVTSGANMTFKYDGSRKIDFKAEKITSVAGGGTDPVIGKYQTIYSPQHMSYDFIMVSETVPGSNIWNLTGGAAKVVLTKSSSEYYTPSKYLLSGYATAQTIDLNTGTITWGPVTDLLVNNTIGSSTLAQFSSYALGSLTMSFTTDSALRTWAQNPTGATQTRAYCGTMTGFSGVPEPSTWVLLLLGTAFLGYAAWRQSQGEDFLFPGAVRM